MKVISVRFGALKSTGNYENERLDAEAVLEDGDTVASVTDALRLLVLTELGYQDKIDRRRNLICEIADLQRKAEKARSDWELLANFLRAQGLRPDAPNAPLLNLLTAGATLEKADIERIEVTEDDIVDDHPPTRYRSRW